MNVKEAIEVLKEMPEDANFVICAHEFPGMQGRAWNVQSLELDDNRDVVSVEGAFPVPEGALAEVPD